MNIDQDQVKLDIDDNKICTLTFNKPNSLNALSCDVLKLLKERLLTISKKDVLGLIIVGQGDKAFVAGADIKEMLDMNNDQALGFSKLGQEVTCMMESLSLPVIACVNGYALGGGLEMALGADFIYCSRNAIFGLPEVKLGLIPGFGGTQRLSRLVGRNIARELIYSGRNIDADEAIKIGLANRVYDTVDDLLFGAKKELLMMQKNSIYAIGKAKFALNNGIDLDLESGLKIEKDIFSDLFNSNDAQEGTRAFTEKRKPSFQHMKREE